MTSAVCPCQKNFFSPCSGGSESKEQKSLNPGSRSAMLLVLMIIVLIVVSALIILWHLGQL